MKKYNIQHILYLVALCICCGVIFKYPLPIGQNKVQTLMKEWMHKEISFPKDAVFTIMGIDTVGYNVKEGYKIVSYIDSIGCVSCKLKLPQWKEFINQINAIDSTVTFMFFFQPKDIEELQYKLFSENFKHPVCLDTENLFFRRNGLCTNDNFQTFLLNENNRIVAVGNPVTNPYVKELYTSLLQNKIVKQENNTDVFFDNLKHDFGEVSLNKEYECNFKLTNIGEEKLIIKDVITSCDCIKAWTNQDTILLGEKAEINVLFKEDDNVGAFYRTIDIFCNSPQSPITITITGNIK